MSKELIGQLKNLKHSEVSPRPEWLKASRDVLMSQIRNTVPSEETNWLGNLWLGMSILLPQKFVFGVVRPLAVLLIVALVGTSGWIATVDASYEAMPGDWLYPAKRMVEKTQVVAASMVGAKNAKTKLHSEFAKRRAGEIKTVVKINDPKNTVRIAGVVNDLKNEIISVNSNLDEIKTEQGAGAVAKEVQKDTDQINSVLNEIKEDLSATTTEEAATISKNLTEAKELTKDATVKVVEVLVAKHQDGEISKEDLVDAIDATMVTAVAEANAKKQTIDTVKTVVDAMAGLKSAVATSTETEKIDTAVTQTNEAATKVGEAVNELTSKATAIKNLVESGNLTEAVSVVKEATETTKEVEKIQDSSINAVQQILSAPAINQFNFQVNEATLNASSTESVTVIVVTTTAMSEPGKLPFSITVTTTLTSQIATGTVLSATTTPVSTSSIIR